MIVLAGTITLDPDKVDDFMEAAITMMEATHAEEGNVEYVFSVDPVVAGQVRIFEQWASDEALTAHMSSPHMAAFGAALGSCGVTGTSLTRFDVATVTTLM